MKTKLSKEDYLNQIREGVVYIYTNLVNGKKYVGQTLHPKSHGKSSRYHSHNTAYEKMQNSINGGGKPRRLSYIDSAIYKYGIENFNYEEVFYIKDKLSVIKPLLDQWEIYYINFYNTQNRNSGYNLAKGGQGIQYEYTCISKCVSIDQYDLNGNYIRTFKNAEECESELNIPRTTIYLLLNNGQNKRNLKYSKIFYDYILKYHDETKCTPEYAKTYKKLKQYDINGNYIRTFKSFKEAEENGYAYKRIHTCIKGELYSYKDCFWKYDNDEENINLTSEQLEELKEKQRKIEEHDNLRDGAHKGVEQVYNKPAIQYYNNGKFVCEFTYRWEAVKYFNEHNLLTTAQVDKRIAIGNNSNNMYPRLPHPEIELCYKGNEENLKYNRSNIDQILKEPYYDRGLTLNEIKILRDRLLQNGDNLSPEGKRILQEFNIREDILNHFNNKEQFEIKDDQVFDIEYIKQIYNQQLKYYKKYNRCKASIFQFK